MGNAGAMVLKNYVEQVERRANLDFWRTGGGGTGEVMRAWKGKWDMFSAAGGQRFFHRRLSFVRVHGTSVFFSCGEIRIRFWRRLSFAQLGGMI